MTVAELIEALKKFDSKAEVRIADDKEHIKISEFQDSKGKIIYLDEID